jgi:Tfp pilus assembly protein PilP
MNEFCRKHNIRVIDTNKRYRTVRPLSPRYFQNPNDYNFVSDVLVEHETEPLYTIEIPLSELDRIKDFEDQVFNNIKNHGPYHYQMFEIMMEQKHKEKKLRDKYAAVKKAYEHYSLMLKLAESGEL